MKIRKKQKKMLLRIFSSFFLLVIAGILLKTNVLPGIWYYAVPVFLIPYILVGYDVWRKAILNIGNGQFLDENFLMVLATVGAFVIGEYPEAVFVMLFYQVGELFQDIAVDRSRNSIASLMNIRPDTARVLRDGVETVCSPEEVAVGELILVRPGEKVPLDGKIVEGNSSLDTVSLTGESVPHEVGVGNEVISGCVNIGGVLTVRVEKAFGESTVQKILELVENSSLVKSKTERTITSFARVYTPLVVFAALALAIIPSIITGDWQTWVSRALIFLVVSCPCALVISVPLSYFAGLGAASKRGVLVKGANYLEALNYVETVIFDKTGTLTEGKFRVSEIICVAGKSEEEILTLAASAERNSNHPIAISIREAAGAVNTDVCDMKELAGFGVSAMLDGERILVGNEKFMQREGIVYQPTPIGKTAVYVAKAGELLGVILISDTPKKTARSALERLKALGVKKTVMLTGDRSAVAKQIADELSVDEWVAELLPTDKVAKTEEILNVSQGKVCFVGDGVNDAPVLARADVGIAMGALGSDAAIEAADVVLMDDQPEKIADAICISRKTSKIVKENIALALCVKFSFLALAMFGFTNLWAATFADVGVSVLAIMNAMRAGTGGEY